MRKKTEKKKTAEKRNSATAWHNWKFQDNSHRVFLGDNTLCAQFLRDYVPIPMLKTVQPQDIEDVSERYLPLFLSEREADVVKKIHLDNEKTAFLVSLIEHKTEVDYNVIMQLLRYMCYIWEDYEKEMLQKKKMQKQGEHTVISTNKDFKYPPIIPIVYYEGKGSWTAAMNLKDRISLSDAFEAYIPDFTYEMIRLHDYSNEQLMTHGNEMSLILLLNKLQSLADMEGLAEVKEYQQNVLADSPEHLLDIIAAVTTILLTKLNLPSGEIEEFVSLIKEKKMPELFEKFERVDVPKLREELDVERKKLNAEREGLNAEREDLNAERKELAAKRAELQAREEKLKLIEEELRKTGKINHG